MFQIGDKVFCPMRGCGIVEAIEKREMLNESQEYCVIKIFEGNMTVMIPTTKIDSSDFRHISDLSTTENLLNVLGEANVTSDAELPAKERLKLNTAKVHAGSLEGYVEVICDLTHIQKIKPLNASEKNLLLKARKYFAAEVSLIKHISTDDVNTLIDNMLC